MTPPPIHFVLPGDPATATGGYVYDRRIVAALRAAGRPVVVHRLADRFPFPAPSDLDAAAATLAAIGEGAAVVVDGLAFGAMPDVARRQAARLRLVALVHHPLARETGWTPAVRDRLFRSERAALASAARVIATSGTTKAELAGYGVPAERIGVVRPGTDPAPLAAGSGGAGRLLLCVATLTPRKGHDVLVEALATLRHRPWRLVCAGSDQRDPATASALRRQIAALDLDNRVVLAGELSADRLAAAYHRADVFVLASRHEGYGMALAEALARGLPIVSTTAGAIPEAVPADAGLLVPPDDPGRLAAALDRVLGDRGLAEGLAEGARRARAALPTWPAAGRSFAAEVAPEGVR